MRIKSIVRSALLGSFAMLSFFALLPDVPPGRAQNSVMSPIDSGPGGRSQLQPMSTTRSILMTGGALEQFLWLDRDGDGLLNFNEMTETLQVERDRWDVNRDGHIDPAEWNRYFNAVLLQQQRSALNSFVRAQNPGPEPKIPESIKQPGIPVAAPPTPNNPPMAQSSARPPFNDNPRRKSATPGGKFPKNLPGWFKDYDVDSDGQVGLYEWQAKKDDLREFKKYDLNDDGFITIEELIRSGQFTANTKAPPTLHGFQAEIGDFFYFEVTGTIRGTVWGTDVYTADSLLAAAGVHAGVLEVGETGLIKLTIAPGQEQYEGSFRNGVASQDFGRFPRSFRIELAK